MTRIIRFHEGVCIGKHLMNPVFIRFHDVGAGGLNCIRIHSALVVNHGRTGGILAVFRFFRLQLSLFGTVEAVDGIFSCYFKQRDQEHGPSHSMDLSNGMCRKSWDAVTEILPWHIAVPVLLQRFQQIAGLRLSPLIRLRPSPAGSFQFGFVLGAAIIVVHIGRPVARNGGRIVVNSQCLFDAFVIVRFRVIRALAFARLQDVGFLLYRIAHHLRPKVRIFDVDIFGWPALAVGRLGRHETRL
mmetsp:Transcript_2649/g.7277  ORF Transcript_2649/g.7277 Transcript_2649/m.7277 type:complete len:243 (-) Transcript_2649:2119-2847(-)